MTEGRRGFHLGVFVQPYLDYVLDGSKTVESRFAITRCPPWHRVSEGDVLVLKRSGGPVVGLCTLGRVWSFQINADTLSHIRQTFTSSLRAEEPAFWRTRALARYATLMRVDRRETLAPLSFEKRDRRGWVVLSERESAMMDLHEK